MIGRPWQGARLRPLAGGRGPRFFRGAKYRVKLRNLPPPARREGALPGPGNRPGGTPPPRAPGGPARIDRW